MRRTAVAGALVAALAAPAGISAGQEKEPSSDEVLRELQRLRQRVDKLERQHAEDQERIRRLEGREAEPPPVPAEPPPAPALPPADIPPGTTDQGWVDKTKRWEDAYRQGLRLTMGEVYRAVFEEI